MANMTRSANSYKQELLTGILGGPSTIETVNVLFIRRFIRFFYDSSTGPGNPHLHKIYTSALEGYEDIWLNQLLKLETERLSLLLNKVAVSVKKENDFIVSSRSSLEELESDIDANKASQDGRKRLFQLLNELFKFIQNCVNNKKKEIFVLYKNDLTLLNDSLSVEMRTLSRVDFMKMHRFEEAGRINNHKIPVEHNIQNDKSQEVDLFLDSAEKESEDELEKKHNEDDLIENLEKFEAQNNFDNKKSIDEEGWKEAKHGNRGKMSHKPSPKSSGNSSRENSLKLNGSSNYSQKQVQYDYYQNLYRNGI